MEEKDDELQKCQSFLQKKSEIKKKFLFNFSFSMKLTLNSKIIHMQYFWLKKKSKNLFHDFFTISITKIWQKRKLFLILVIHKWHFFSKQKSYIPIAYFSSFQLRERKFQKQIQQKFCKLPPFLSWIRVPGWKYLDMDKYGWLLDIPDNTDSTNIVHTTT